MKAIILHLSDSHITTNNCAATQRYKQIAATIRTIMAEADHLFIAYTGDITQAGEEDEFVVAGEFITNLKVSLSEDFKGAISIVMTPGNHDGTFKKAKSTRQSIINQVKADDGKSIDEDVINDCTDPLQNYYNFENAFGQDGIYFGDKLWRDYRFNLGEKIVRFSSLNASWMSTVPEAKSDLIFPVDKYSSIYEDAATVNVLLLHHPLNWYAQVTYHPLRQMTNMHYQIVMSGHEHIPRTSVVSDFQDNSLIMLEAPALSSGSQSSFSVILMDLENKTISQECFSWDGSIFAPTSGTAHWETKVKIPQCRLKNGFHLTDEAKCFLGSLDASFNHPRKELIQLSDVFVYPDLMDISTDKEKPESMSAAVLVKNASDYSKVLIYGDEQFGKTSLLKQLFVEFLRDGLAPVMIDASDTTGSTEQFRRIIDRQVEYMYGKYAAVRYSQASFESKIALIDNADEIGGRGDVLARALSNIEGQFGRVIITAGERYEVTVMASVRASSAIANYKDFRMLGFGYKLRHDLIRRWYEVGQEFDERELQEKVFFTEKVINSVLGKGLVPMTAFNTLVLIQTVEVNEKGSLANAGMAQYYEYMLRHCLKNANVRNDELDEIQSYLVHLAWEMFQKNTKILKFEELAKFNMNFSGRIQNTDLRIRLSLLEDSKILVSRNDGYAFAFSYLEYFFVAKYLAINCEDQPELKETIVHLCRHLYLKDNANIVLFLTHHMHGKWVIQEIANLLSAILSDVPALQLENDAEILNTWVSDKARILIDTTNVVENNRAARESEDDASVFPEDLHVNEVSSISELDQITQLNLLFKTSEILGQILKGRYGSILKEVKVDLVTRLFDAPLRGVNFFNSLVNSEPEGILLEISSRFQKNFPSLDKDKADRVAKKFLFSVLGAVADSFISRQGEILGSPKLVETIDQVAKNNGGLSYELVAVSAKLSYPNNPPVEKIRELAAALDNNYFGYKLLQNTVARHLYMFYLPLTDRTRLASSVGIDVPAQRAIELKSQSTKKLPNSKNTPLNANGLLVRLNDSFLMNNQATLDAIEKRYGRQEKDPSARPPRKVRLRDRLRAKVKA